MSGRRERDPPGPSALRPFTVPEVDSRAVGEGMSLDAVVVDRLPLVTVHLGLEVGEAGVSPDLAGIASLTATALQGGAGDRSGEALAEALEGLGSGISAWSGWDTTRLTLTCLPERLSEAFAILADVVRRPTFPPDEVTRSRDQRLAQIEHERSDPRALGNHSAARYIYAPDEPFGRRLGGHTDTVAPLDADALRDFHRTWYGPGGAFLVVVGDVDEDEVESAAVAAFADWRGGSPSPPAPTCRPRAEEAGVWVVHRPGAVQSEIRIGHVGVPRAIPDWFPLRIFNAVLGGTFTSRLNLNLREEHGYTYGVRSQFAARRAAGPFTVATAVDTPVTADAAREAVAEIVRMVSDGPTEGEAASAREYLAGVFPLQWATTSAVASRRADLHAFDLPRDYWQTYRDRIRAVTAADAHAAGMAHVHPDRLQVVVVGDAERVREPLQTLDLGPVRVVEPV